MQRKTAIRLGVWFVSLKTHGPVENRQNITILYLVTRILILPKTGFDPPDNSLKSIGAHA